jgi:hypothetical protein
MDPNITMARKANTLTITIQLAGPGVTPTPSSTGKTDVIASTRGNVAVPGDGGYKVGINLYRPRAG